MHSVLFMWGYDEQDQSGFPPPKLVRDRPLSSPDAQTPRRHAQSAVQTVATSAPQAALPAMQGGNGPPGDPDLRAIIASRLEVIALRSPSLVGWRQLLLGWRSWLLGWRPSLVGWGHCYSKASRGNMHA